MALKFAGEQPGLGGRSGAIVVYNHMQEDDPQPKFALLKPTDLAVQLSVFYEAAKTGRTPSIRIGGEHGPVRFVPEDIQRWIDDARGVASGPLCATDPAFRRCPAQRSTYQSPLRR